MRVRLTSSVFLLQNIFQFEFGINQSNIVAAIQLISSFKRQKFFHTLGVTMQNSFLYFDVDARASLANVLLIRLDEIGLR